MGVKRTGANTYLVEAQTKGLFEENGMYQGARAFYQTEKRFTRGTRLDAEWLRAFNSGDDVDALPLDGKSTSRVDFEEECSEGGPQQGNVERDEAREEIILEERSLGTVLEVLTREAPVVRGPEKNGCGKGSRGSSKVGMTEVQSSERIDSSSTTAQEQKNKPAKSSLAALPAKLRRVKPKIAI